MKKLLPLLILAFVLAQCSSMDEEGTDGGDGSRDVAETTLPAFMGEFDDIDESQPDNVQVCRARVTATQPYNLRKDPVDQAGNQCGLLVPKLPGGKPNSVVILGNMNDWIKVSSSATKNCPGGIGYVHEKAFFQGRSESADLRMFKNGECGRAAYDPGRTPIPKTAPTRPSQTVETRNGYSYRFPLPRCLGLKHKGGRGEYGASRYHGSHAGCDYYSPKETPVYAPCSGRVEASGRFGNAGYMITLKCNNGALFKFMHMHPTRPPRARGGQRVSIGSVIGGVSNTGNASRQAPHLHVEYYAPPGQKRNRDNPQKLWNCGGNSGH